MVSLGWNFRLALQQLHVHPAGVTHQTKNGHLGALGYVNIQILVFQPPDQVLLLLLGGSVFQNRNHFSFRSLQKNKRRTEIRAAQGFIFASQKNCSTNFYYLFASKK